MSDVIEEFRWRGLAGANLFATYYGVIDRRGAGGSDLAVQGSTELPRGFRAVANVNYLSSYLFRQTFTTAYNEAINTEVNTTAFVTNHFNSYDFHLGVFRYQNFQSTLPGDSIQIRSFPSVQFSRRERQYIV